MEPVLRAAPEVRPVDSGFFAGVLDYRKMNVLVRMVMKSRMQAKGVPEETTGTGTQLRHGQRPLLSPSGKGGRKEREDRISARGWRLKSRAGLSTTKDTRSPPPPKFNI